jgi:thiaminase
MVNDNNKLTLFEDMQKDFTSITNTIHNHPYIDSLEKKQIDKDKLEMFICEQYKIIANDKRNFAFRVSKTLNDEASKLFMDCLTTEINALENLKLLAEAMSVDRKRMELYEPLSGCQAYTNYLTKLAVYGSDSEVLTALLIDLPVWGHNCHKMSSILQKNYGFDSKSCAFLDSFASTLPKEFTDKSKELIVMSVTVTSNNEKSIRTAARLILDYELLFWNTLYEYSIIKTITNL